MVYQQNVLHSTCYKLPCLPQNRHYSAQIFSSVVGTINQNIFTYKYTKVLVTH